jgi:hypothetical protein
MDYLNLKRARELDSILTLNLLMTTIVAPPSNASKWQMGFNSAFKGLKDARHLNPHQEVLGSNLDPFSGYCG